MENIEKAIKRIELLKVARDSYSREIGQLERIVEEDRMRDIYNTPTSNELSRLRDELSSIDAEIIDIARKQINDI